MQELTKQQSTTEYLNGQQQILDPLVAFCITKTQKQARLFSRVGLISTIYMSKKTSGGLKKIGLDPVNVHRQWSLRS